MEWHLSPQPTLRLGQVLNYLFNSAVYSSAHNRTHITQLYHDYEIRGKFIIKYSAEILPCKEILSSTFKSITGLRRKKQQHMKSFHPKQQQGEMQQDAGSSSVWYLPDSGWSLHSAMKTCSWDTGVFSCW